MKQSKAPEQQSNSTGTSHGSGQSHSLTNSQKARRRLLGATLGAPVIYTLSSGASQAASSSYCEYRDESTEPFGTDDSDTSESPLWGTVREEDGFVSDGTQWVSGSCWSSMQMSVIDSSTKIV